MLLRRITEHVKAQNWTAVALDFVIVVVGVFIGIQVANWNDDQAAKKRGGDYVERLLGDLETDLKSANALVAYYTAVRESADRALVLLNTAEPDAKELVLNAYRASELIYYPSTRSTWDQVVSSGELGLLPRDAVDNGLALYFSRHGVRLEVSRDLHQSAYRENIRGLIPHSLQKAIRADCSDYKVYGEIMRFRAECTLDSPEAIIEETADILLQDKALQQHLRYHVSTIEKAYISLTGQINLLERNIALLENERKR